MCEKSALFGEIPAIEQTLLQHGTYDEDPGIQSIQVLTRPLWKRLRGQGEGSSCCDRLGFPENYRNNRTSSFEGKPGPGKGSFPDIEPCDIRSEVANPVPVLNSGSVDDACRERVEGMSAPRVAHLVWGLNVGGGEKVVLQLASGMLEGAYDPVICCITGGTLDRDIASRGIEVETLGLSRRSILNFPHFVFDVVKTLAALTSFVRRREVEIIHSHNFDCAILGALAGKMAGIGTVATFHGLRILRDGRARLDPRNFLRLSFYRLSAKLTDRLIAVSEPVGEMLRHVTGVAGKITVIENGIDVQEYGKPVNTGEVLAGLRLHPGRTVITCVARLSPAKGHEYLIEAAVKVVKRHPEAVFLIVGDGRMLTRLTNLVSCLHLQDHVLFLRERDDVPCILAASDIFAFPSLSEGFGLAVIEAMAAGKPVVANRIPPLTGIVGDGLAGLLVPPACPSSLAEALLRLCEDRSLARKMGAAGRERAVNLYDFKRTLAATERVYDEVLKELASLP